MELFVVPLSAAPLYGVLYFLVGAFLILLACVIAALVIRHKRLRKPTAIAAIIILAVAASAYLVWSIAPSIDYWLMTDQTYPASGTNTVTITCQNNGDFAGTFSLKIQFGSAEFSNQTRQPYTQLDSRSAQFTYTVQPGETQTTTVYFTINNGVSDFYIDLHFQQSGLNFFVKGERGGVASTSFQKDIATGNFTERVYVPPP
jgi:hypothetical protein